MAEDLHGDDLGVRGDALYVYGFQGGGEGAVLVGDVGVCRRDPGYVGTVFCLAVVVMGDIQGPVDIIEAERQLVADE